MKKIILTVGVLSSILLAGCVDESQSETNTVHFKTVKRVESEFGYGNIIRDPDTGCMYYSYEKTPYFDKEGKVAGCGELK